MKWTKNFCQHCDTNWARSQAGRNYAPAYYSLTVQPDPDSAYPCSEYYLVLPDAPISREALALGTALDGIPGLLYAIDPPDDGWGGRPSYTSCAKPIPPWQPTP